MDDIPEPLADNASKQQVKDFINKALNAHAGSSQGLLFSLYFPLAEAWVRLKSMEKTSITAARATSANGTELKGAKAYCQNEFGKSHETIRLCAAALPYKDRAKAALDWFNNPGRNEWRDWFPSKHFGPQFIVEVVEAYQNKDQPPPPKKQRPPKEAEPLVSVPSDAEALTIALGQVEALKAQADTVDLEMKTKLEVARQEIAKRDERIDTLETLLRENNIDLPVEPLPSTINDWLKSIGEDVSLSDRKQKSTKAKGSHKTGRKPKATKEVVQQAPAPVGGGNATEDAGAEADHEAATTVDVQAATERPASQPQLAPDALDGEEALWDDDLALLAEIQAQEAATGNSSDGYGDRCIARFEAARADVSAAVLKEIIAARRVRLSAIPPVAPMPSSKPKGTKPTETPVADAGLAGSVVTRGEACGSTADASQPVVERGEDMAVDGVAVQPIEVPHEAVISDHATKTTQEPAKSPKASVKRKSLGKSALERLLTKKAKILRLDDEAYVLDWLPIYLAEPERHQELVEDVADLSR
jgi:hypothetical protein